MKLNSQKEIKIVIEFHKILETVPKIRRLSFGRKTMRNFYSSNV